METVGKELLTLLKTHHDGCSLYALHDILGLSTQAVYDIANGHSSMGADTILIACDVLGIDSRPWLIRAELDRCRSPKRRQILERILSELDSPAGRAIAGLWLFCVVVIPGVFGT